MPKVPKKLAEAAHIDDFMDFKREAREALKELDNRMDRTDERVGNRLDRHEERMTAIEKKNTGLQESMEALQQSLETVRKAIIGDITKPEQPGMAENVRSLKGDLEKLVKMHEDEAKEKAKPLDTAHDLAKELVEEVKGQVEKKSDGSPDIPWKAIMIALGIIGGLVAIIWKILPLIN